MRTQQMKLKKTFPSATCSIQVSNDNNSQPIVPNDEIDVGNDKDERINDKNIQKKNDTEILTNRLR